MDATEITQGTKLIITDASGTEHEAEALSGVEHKGHSFPIVWVNRPLKSGGFDPTPWPADAVRAVSNA